MYIHGTFQNVNDETIEVRFVSNGDTSTEKIIGVNGLFFAGSPLTVETDIEDTFTHIIRQSLAVNLVTKDYVGNLFFSGGARDIEVTVENLDSGVILFYGYVIPNTFTQPFVEGVDEFTVNCVDYLSTLQYYNYKGTTVNNYNTKKASADFVTLKDILLQIFPNKQIYYDRSKEVESKNYPVKTYLARTNTNSWWNTYAVLNKSTSWTCSNAQSAQVSAGDYIMIQGITTDTHKPRYIISQVTGKSTTSITGKCVAFGDTLSIFEDLSISELNFYGDDAEDIKNYEEVLNEILQYLNLHIIQVENSFFIFDWETFKNDYINWFELVSNVPSFGQKTTVAINADTFADADTNISMSEVYSQISVSCPMETQETLIENPLDSDSLTSLYSGKQLYMTEYISEGSGNHANSAFNKIVKGQSDTYKDCKVVNWFNQVMTNSNWKMNIGNDQTIESIFEKDSNGTYINQWKIPKYLKDNALTPAILRFGSYEIKGGEITDNSPVSKIDMKDYLCISVNGNEDSSENNHLPSDTTLRDKAPIIEYVGTNSGGVFSPADDETTNYLVFSGKMLLQPIQYESGQDICSRNNNYQTIFTNGAAKTEGVHANKPDYTEGSGLPVPNNLIKSDNNEEGRYYTRKFYTQTKVSDEPTTYLTSGNSFQPWTTDKSAHGYEYNYSASGDGSDRYSKLPVLECELIIGDKRLIETDIDMYGNSTFQWVTVGSEPTETIDGVTYPITTFSLGVNPKIGDYIIGDEYDIQNTIKYQMNLDAEGTAIPIKKSDALSGKVTFRILGTINTLWNDISRRHPSFWRHTQWSTNARFILAHTENIFIKDFECKIYSDNGLNENAGSDELVYMSAVNDSFINKKDDIEFSLVTQLTSSEAVKKGISTAVILNTPIETSTKLPVRNIYNKNTDEVAKAEEHYIDEYYREYSTPKIILELSTHNEVTISDNYTWNRLGKTFFIQGINKDIRFNKNTLTLKEI